MRTGIRAVGIGLLSVVLASRLGWARGQAPAQADLRTLLHTQRLLQAGDQGQGVRIGVISTGASNYAALVRRGVLPADVAFYGGDGGQDDEGDWMMQIVHQIAPRAQLAFCQGGPVVQTVACARKLATQFGASLIVDDTNPQPVFEFPTPKARGLAELAHEHPDVLFFTGAGNNGGGYYEGPWTPTLLIVNGTRYLAQDFGRSLGEGTDPYDSFALPRGRAALVMLGTSADPNGEPGECKADNPDVTLALLDARGDILESQSGHCPVLQVAYHGVPLPWQRPSLPPRPLRSQALPPRPMPAFRLSPQTLRIAVLLPEGSHPQSFQMKLLAMLDSAGVSPLALDYRTDGSAGNSATAHDLIAVAAVDPNSGWHDRYLYEPFANSGPQCLQYAPNLSGGWTRLPGPQCVRQPSFVVPDRTLVFMPTPDGDQYRPFVGDSAAGPSAAGVAALLLSAGVAPNRILELLERTAISQTDSGGWDPHYGYGLIDADAAAVAAGVLNASVGNPPDSAGTAQLVTLHVTPAFLEDHNLFRRATQGDPQALSELEAKAQSGDADAQACVAEYAHETDDNTAAARWALSAAKEGEPRAQSLLGSLYNRGWGVPVDPRAAQAWWLRAAHAGVVDAIFNIGTTVAGGRGATLDPVLGYALMRAAALRNMRFPPMEFEIARARVQLSPRQIQDGERLAARFAADPASIPVP